MAAEEKKRIYLINQYIDRVTIDREDKQTVLDQINNGFDLDGTRDFGRPTYRPLEPGETAEDCLREAVKTFIDGRTKQGICQSHRFTIGSRSSIKRDALREACDRCGFSDAVLETVSASSGQNPQPYGYQETYSGALARALEAKRRFPDHISVGIENGILPFVGLMTEATQIVDVAVIVIIDTEGHHHADMSMGMEFPPDALEIVRDSGFKQTVGELLANEDPDCLPTDPHAYLTGNSYTRQSLLADTLERMLKGIS